MSEQTFAEYIHQIPKLLLHVHIEGSIPPATLLRLSRKNGVDLPFNPISDNLSCLINSDFDHFLTVYESICECVQEKNDFSRIIADYAQEVSQHNVRYVELHFSPWRHISRNVPSDSIIDGLVEGIQRAETISHVKIRIICDIVREENEEGLTIVDWILDAPKDYFIGLGISGKKGAAPLKEYRRCFERAAANGLHLVAHAGEFEGSHSVRQAIEYLDVTRIGHGVRAAEDPKVLELILQNRVHLEVCPTSNVTLGVYSIHNCPVGQLLSAGISLSINTDDDLLFNTNITKEFLYLYREGLIDETTVTRLTLEAFENSFMSSDERLNFHTELKETLEVLP